MGRQRKRASFGAPSFKEVLRSGGVTIGSWVTLAHPAVAEIMAKAGFDWLTVDLEHSVITIREAEELIRVIELCGVAPLVRLSANDPVQIKRVMDAGAHGIIVPMVNSPADAERAVAAAYYPPRGQRGVGLARAQWYGARFEEYAEWLRGSAVIIVLIEHIAAVRSLDKILSVDGVDGFMIGPYDLSSSLGVPGEFDHPAVVEALREVQRVVAAGKTTAGFHVVQPDPKQAMRRLREGYRLLAFGMDTLFLGNSCRQSVGALRTAAGLPPQRRGSRL